MKQHCCLRRSLLRISFDQQDHENETHNWIGDRIARGEKLMHLLLDRGASANDAIIDQRDDNDGQPPQPDDNVLALAVSRASYKLMKRLIDGGADIHARKKHFDSDLGGASFGRTKTTARDVTALHYGSFFRNSEGIQALLDHRGSDVDIADMVSARDSNGRLPLHWAAAGPGPVDEALLSENDIVPRTVDTFKLLLTRNSNTINVQDNEGRTALHYAVSSRAGCGSRHSDLAIRFLCKYGADAGLQDSTGQTVLPNLSYWSVHGEPINTALIDLLAHGAIMDHADKDGITALPIMAKVSYCRLSFELLLGLGQVHYLRLDFRKMLAELDVLATGLSLQTSVRELMGLKTSGNKGNGRRLSYLR